MPGVEGVVENWRISFFLCAFFVSRLFLNYCMWLKGLLSDLFDIIEGRRRSVEGLRIQK